MSVFDILAGYKTYIAGGVALMTGLVLLANGKTEVGVEFCVTGLGLIGLRNFLERAAGVPTTPNEE